MSSRLVLSRGKMPDQGKQGADHIALRDLRASQGNRHEWVRLSEKIDAPDLRYLLESEHISTRKRVAQRWAAVPGKSEKLSTVAGSVSVTTCS
jgi:hypothetical protein